MLEVEHNSLSSRRVRSSLHRHGDYEWAVTRSQWGSLRLLRHSVRSTSAALQLSEAGLWTPILPDIHHVGHGSFHDNRFFSSRAYSLLRALFWIAVRISSLSADAIGLDKLKPRQSLQDIRCSFSRVGSANGDDSLIL